MKEYFIENGQGILNIICDGFISAFQLNSKSITATWPDCSGSIGMYISSSNCEIENHLSTQLNHSLNNSNVEAAEKLLYDFLKLFSNGRYQVEFHDEIKEFDIHYVHKHDSDENFSYNYYPAAIRNFLFTQNSESLDVERVKHYKRTIENGGRPIALVYSHLYFLEKEFESKFPFNDNVWSEEFIIDGHHKMKAYDELRVSPNYFQIRKILKTDDLDFDSFERVNYLLNKSELEHFVLNSLEFRFDNSIESKCYNEILDNHLLTAERLDYQLLFKMAKNLKSENFQLINWANDRFNTIYRRVQNLKSVIVPEFQISKFEGDKYVVWNRVVSSEIEFENWKQEFIIKTNDE